MPQETKFVTIKEILDGKAPDTVNLTAALKMKNVRERTVNERGKELQLMENILLLDTTGQICLTAWEDDISILKDGTQQGFTCFHFQDLRVKECQKRKYLTTSKATLIAHSEVDIDLQSIDDDELVYDREETITVPEFQFASNYSKLYICKTRNCNKKLTELQTVDVAACVTCGYQRVQDCALGLTGEIRIPDHDNNLTIFMLISRNCWTSQAIAVLLSSRHNQKRSCHYC